MQDHVALGERPALGVLAGQADRGALGQQRGEGERLGVGPVDPAVGAQRAAALLEDADELGVDGEALGDGEQLLVEPAQALGRDGGRDLGARRAVELVLAGLLLDVVAALGDAPLEVLVLERERLPDGLGHLVGLGPGDRAALDQRVGVELAHRRVALDLRVHLGLGVGGLVGLVVAEAAVADQVDQHVVAELLAEGEGQAHGGDAALDVVGVDVDDRDVVALGHVGGPPGRAGVLGIGGEADLVVLDQVDGAADAVAVDRLQVERLGDHALAGEGGVAVQDDRHGGVRVLVGVRALAARLDRARGAVDDRRDELEVARVALQADADRLAVAEVVVALGAVVVLDVAGAALGDRRDGLERGGALELGEDRVVRPAEVVGEHVEPAAVGHADHDLAGALAGRELDQLVDHRHGHVEALDRELLLARGRPCAGSARASRPRSAA